MADHDRSAGEPSFSTFLDDYFAECDEHLMAARRLLLALERSIGQGQLDRAVIDDLFRHYHSIKGISGMVELRPAEDMAHALEEYLRALRSGTLAIDTDGVDALVDGTQTLEQVVVSRRNGGEAPPIETAVARLTHLVAAGISVPGQTSVERGLGKTASPPDPRRSVWRFRFVPSRDLVARGVRVETIKQRLTSIGDVLEAVPVVSADGRIAFEFLVRSVADPAAFEAWSADGVSFERSEDSTPLPDADLGLAPASPERAPLAVAPSHYVRVDLTRLDELMRTVGDLVITRARLFAALGHLEGRISPGEWRDLQESDRVLESQLRSLREGIMRVRLVPVDEIFRRMPFAVRDLARETGKRVRLRFHGQSTEIDKFLVERMLDPVLHLVRNAVSHGIESVDERIAAGKPPEATLTLSASTAGDTVRLEIADDGRGIDRSAVAARARQLGLAPSGAEPGDEELLATICAPGFSTRVESDRVSGRGVGMAVVKSAVEELSGTLQLHTEVNVGTRFVVDLPVTLAITDALIAAVGEERLAVPLGSVREVIEVSVAEMRAIERHDLVPYRGAALPIVRLSRVLGLPDANRERLHCFVIGAGLAAVGIVVDRIIGQREIVVRAVSDPLVRVDGIAGATDLGDGKAVLILDPPALLAKAGSGRGSRLAPRMISATPHRQRKEQSA
jgi:two-component system chemotaxis sensor kinase CheA